MIVGQETAFEKPRGINKVELRPDFAQVHVSRLEEPLMEQRLRVLRAVADLKISIDFLKLTPSGLSFLVAENRMADIDSALKPTGVHYSIRGGRSILIVHAVNMRDEEGLIAGIVQQAMSGGVLIDHISDMHDRLLMVMSEEDAPRVDALLRKEAHAN